MKSHKIQLLFVLLIVVTACKTKPETKGSPEIETAENAKSNTFLTIDFAGIIKHKQEVPVSKIAGNVEFIQFENSDKALLGRVMDVQLTKDYIFIKHTGSNLLTQFDRSGKFIRHIGKEGRGPKEYGLMRTFSIDEKKKLIYIHTNWTRKILVYNFEGEYVNTIKLDGFDRLQMVWAHDSIFVSFSEPNMGTEPFVFIETDFNGDTLQTIQNHIFWEKKEQNSFLIFYSGRDNFYLANNKLHMKGWYNDTVYTYNEKNKIVPKFLVDLKDHKIPDDLIPEKMSGKPLPKECYWLGVNESAAYIFVRYGSHMDKTKSKDEMEEGCILYNKKTKEGVALKNKGEEYGFVNDLNGGPDFKPRFSNDSLMFVDVTALDMKQYLDSQTFKNCEAKFPEQKEKLVQLGNTLKEDDNSFLMVAKLKK
ncbi:6-bladed beta-propeller [Maribellus maritimus]|uniref:6-bladed beta-propeller n=1 Tax=Maribellus maritimus TaxID=2870838 RepID=UPI001EEC0B40|nr:6-bladed beta-propeller [Maribellus maritimus]MCG6189343.1 6-bladed beta-propeller [Maribellus maritimus]